ncbi:hypothetical protein BpHYR1_033479 [Brachionus plicatilis]|uniref:Uncharacterized protein n=1 Tax=Brachionus plicatilis TaxID=10195 RepID=A0A3M7QW33_BRAPC|nr:hypothetical protein BpHYR1_033479 [Brachionus plicatilis]
MSTDYYRVIQLNSPERVGRLRRALTKKRKYLKEQAFEQFNIPYESFHNILNDHEEDKLFIQFFQKTETTVGNGICSSFGETTKSQIQMNESLECYESASRGKRIKRRNLNKTIKDLKI